MPSPPPPQSPLLVLVPLLVLLLLSPSISGRPVTVILTSRGTNDRLTPQTPIDISSTPAVSSSSSGIGVMAATVTIDKKVTFQRILGFGGAFTEATAYTMAQLRPDLQNEILQVRTSTPTLFFRKRRHYCSRW